MLDIVERLRKATDTNTPVDCGTHWNLEEEAADEIEKLRSVLGVTRGNILSIKGCVGVGVITYDIWLNEVDKALGIEVPNDE
jgi:hypothetical protein